MGNILQRMVYPGCPVASAREHLEAKGFHLSDICATFRDARPSSEPGRTIAFFHGNAEDVSRAIRSGIETHKASLSVHFEYPGYGWRGSETASQFSFLADLPRQMEWVTKNPPKGGGGIVIHGRSLGSFAALTLAVALGPMLCRGVILISPLLTATATKVPPPLHRALAAVDYADNETLARKLHPSIPVLIVHGDLDMVVPLSNGVALWETLPKTCRKTFKTVLGRGHNDITRDAEVIEEIGKFLDGL